MRSFLAGVFFVSRGCVGNEKMAREVVLTQEGFEKLKSEIEYLSTEKRREVAERIKEAREFGDIMENAEYDHAKNEQAMLEARISQLEDKLRSATILDQRSVDKNVVSIGSKVRVKDQKSGKSVLYQIVGSAEADPAENKVSNESPVGQALLGHKRGDVVTVAVPRGPNRRLKVTKIETV
jgi:transcription elongation factor GreA